LNGLRGGGRDMPVEIKCANCGYVVRRLWHLNTMIGEELKELEGKKCPRCGHKFTGKRAGPITVKAYP